MSLRLLTVVGVSSVMVWGAGCGQLKPEEPIGEASVALTEVPVDVLCIRLTAAGSRVVEKTFTSSLFPQDSVVGLQGLPLGDVSFTGEAYMAPCSAISGAIPEWVGGPVNATLSAGVIAQVTIVMKHNGKAKIGVDFDDPTCAIAGDACTTDNACCGGPNLVASCQSGACSATCTAGFADCNGDIPRDGCEANLQTDVNNCGNCGFVCPFSCHAGFCVNSELTVNGATIDGFRISNGSATTSGITAPLVDGGLCNATGAGWAGAIVLCQRGGAFFSDKAQNVQDSGGLAAVVYDNVAEDLFIGTLLRPSAIPVIIIHQQDGQNLVAGDLGLSATLVSPP